MKLLASTPRRITAAATLAAVGVLLPAAALAAPARSGSPAPRPAAIQACHGPGQHVWLGLGQGAAGMNKNLVPIEFSNTTRHACRLTGAPTITVIGRHGQVGNAATASPGQRSVVVPAGGTAHVVLIIVNADVFAPNCHPATGQLDITLGGTGTDLSGYPVTQCRNKNFNTLSVDAIHPGIGVPAVNVR